MFKPAPNSQICEDEISKAILRRSKSWSNRDSKKRQRLSKRKNNVLGGRKSREEGGHKLKLWPREVGKLLKVTQLVMAKAGVIPGFKDYCTPLSDMVFPCLPFCRTIEKGIFGGLYV